jgi:hypothetical protein
MQQNAGPDRAMLVAVKLANGKEPTDSRLPATYNRYRDGVPLPGIFWLFAIGELDGDKHCAIMDQHFGA